MNVFVIILYVISLIAVSHQQTCTVAENQDIGLPNLAVHSSRADTECCQLCEDNPSCKGYAWNDYMKGTCWLKAGSEPLVWTQGVKSGKLESSGGNAELVTQDEFVNAITSLGYPTPSDEQYNSFIQGIPHGSITDKQEAAMALTHFTWESAGLLEKREIACRETGCPRSYETPGCDVDGQDYYGRGYIQLSWCFNYKPASVALFGDERLVTDADQVARDEPTAWNTAFWFWQVNVHSKDGVAQGMFGVTTRAINGALECDGEHQDTARHRYEMYKVVRRAFSLPGDGDERGCYN